MTYSKRVLEQQLAEIAAGRRTHVDGAHQYVVTSQETEQATALRRSASDQARAMSDMAASQRLAAEAAKEAEHTARIALENQERHQRRVEEIEAERNEEVTRHNAELEEIERERTERVAEAAERTLHEARLESERAQAHRAELLRVEQARDALAYDHAELERQRKCPSYTSALTLQRLHALRRPATERIELEALLSPAGAALTALARAVAQSDAQEAERHQSHTAEFESRKSAWVEAEAQRVHRFEQEKRRHERQIGDCAQDVDAANREVTRLESIEATNRTSLNPMSWLGAAKEKRLANDAALKKARSLLSDLNERLAALHSRAPSAAKPSPAPEAPALDRVSRGDRIRRVAEESGAAAELGKLTDAIEQWFESTERSDDLEVLLGMFGSVGDFVSFEECQRLELMRADGAKDVAYPGLGVLPFGEALQRVNDEIHAIEARGSLLDPDSNPPVGWTEYRTLRSAVGLGVLLAPDVGQSDGQPSDFLFRLAKQMLQDDGLERVTHSMLSGRLEISYNQATNLLERLERAGLVATMDTKASRRVLSSIHA